MPDITNLEGNHAMTKPVYEDGAAANARGGGIELSSAAISLKRIADSLECISNAVNSSTFTNDIGAMLHHTLAQFNQIMVRK